MAYPSPDLYPSESLFPTLTDIVVHPPRESWMAVEVESSEGIERFGPDGELVSGISFATQNAGGFGQASFTVPKPTWATREDLLLSPVRFYGPGGETRYEGRIADLSAVDQHACRVDCEGWAAHLDDDEFFRELYVDRDLSKWGAMSDSMRLIVLLFGITPSDGQMTPDTSGDQTLLLAISGNASTIDQQQRIHYDAPVDIASVYWGWEAGGSIDGTWTAKLIGAAVEDFSTSDDTANQAGVASDTGTLTMTIPAVRHLAAYLQTPAGDGGTDGAVHEGRWKNVAVFGDHGLTLRGAEPTHGFHPGDIIGHAVGAGAPLLRVGDVQIGGAVIQQAAYLDGQTVRSVVEDAGQYGTPDQQVPEWGVYEGREFFWRSPGAAGRRWRVRRDQMATPTEDGPSAQERVAEIVVVWQDATGQSFSVGPPGSGADSEDERLRTDDWRNNPAAKVPLRRARLDVGQTYLEGAVLLGQAELAERNARHRRGTCVLSGRVRDASGNDADACAVRACDTLVVEDEEGVTAPEEQYVNGTTYDHDSGICTATLGVEPLGVEIVLASLRNAVGV